MQTIYRVMPTRKALDSFCKRTKELVPMLNEAEDGDKCYDDREAAIRATLIVTRNINAPRDCAIVHIEYNSVLHEMLAHDGDIRCSDSTDCRDALGTRIWKLTGKGSAALNRQAKITMEVISIPEFTPPETHGVAGSNQR